MSARTKSPPKALPTPAFIQIATCAVSVNGQSIYYLHALTRDGDVYEYRGGIGQWVRVENRPVGA